MLAESQRGGAGAHPSPLNGQRPDGAPPFGPPRVAAVGSSSGSPGGGIPTGPGSSRSVDALSLEEEERQRRDFQRAFGVTPEVVARAQWQRSTRDHSSLDPPTAAGGSGPSLHWVGGAATHGLSRPAADTARLRQVAQVFRDAEEEASTAASDGTPAPGRSASVASALAAAQGPSPLTRAEGKALMHTSRQFAGDTPLGLVTFLGNFQTTCDGSGLNEGTTVTLLQYFVTSEVLGVLQCAEATHTTRQLTYTRAVRALLNEYLDGDDLVDHLQSLMQATQEKWEDEHEFANRILEANRALGPVLQEAELKSIVLKGVGREVRALGRNLNTQGRTFPKLRKFLAKTGAATREARGVKLQAKPKGSSSRSAGGKEREPLRARTAASVALPLGAASAAATLAVKDYGTEAERAEWAAVLAASVTPPEHCPVGDAPVLPVDSLPPASSWRQQPAWGGRPEMYPIHTGVGRRRGTLAPGTPVPPRAGTVFPYSDRPPRFPRGGAPAPRGGGGAGPSASTPAPRRRGACYFCGHLGHWVWECPAQSPEVRAHGRALRDAVAAHRSGRGLAAPPPLPLGAGPPVPPPPLGEAASGGAPPGTSSFVHSVATDDQAYPDGRADDDGSSSEEWSSGDGDGGRTGHTQGSA